MGAIFYDGDRLRPWNGVVGDRVSIADGFLGFVFGDGESVVVVVVVVQFTESKEAAGPEPFSTLVTAIHNR